MEDYKIVKLYNNVLSNKPNSSLYSQIVWDFDDKKARIDFLLISEDDKIHEDIHLDLTRKQAFEMIKILENHLLYNRK